jgi:SAM-dependent methyltransferase
LGDVTGLDLVHLQCHFGLDTLAWADAGATVTGLDFSQPAVDRAIELARRAGLDGRATFVRADVHDAVEVLGGLRFDVVTVSLGALCWLPGAGRWADQVAGLLRPGGRLHLHDVHPLTLALDDDGERLAHPYFEHDAPMTFDEPGTYTDVPDGLTFTHTTSHSWNHGIGEVVGSLLSRGLRLDRLVEHDWTVFAAYPWLVEGPPGIWRFPDDRTPFPLSFTVVATRT